MTMEIEEWNSFIETWINSSERRSLGTAARTAGALTILGAGYIIHDIVKDAARRKSTKNRIILFMSICDFLDALVHALIAPFMVPEGIGVPGAVGNQLTCDIQGFVSNATGFASSLYNTSLALCYFLMVRYEYSDDRLRKLEPYFLYLPIIYSLVVAISGLPFGIYNYYGSYTCFTCASPLYCDKPESPIECERGELYMYWFYWSGSMFCLEACVIILCMVKMYTAVIHQERGRAGGGDRCRFSFASFMRRIRHPSRSIQNNNASNMMRSQGLWYSGAFLFTFVPAMIFVMWQSYWVHLICVFTFHLMGFTNAVIYVRPRFLKFRQDFPSFNIASSVWCTLVRKRPSPANMNNRTTITAYSSSTSPNLLPPTTTSSVVATMGSSGEERNPSDDPLTTASCQEGNKNNGDNERSSSSVESEEGKQLEEIVCVVPEDQHIEQETNGVDLEGSSDETEVQDKFDSVAEDHTTEHQ